MDSWSIALDCGRVGCRLLQDLETEGEFHEFHQYMELYDLIENSEFDISNVLVSGYALREQNFKTSKPLNSMC